MEAESRRDPTSPRGAPTRRVHCEDALPWLERNTPLVGCSVVTSLPDRSGLPGLSLEGWREWFIEAAVLVLNATPEFGVAIFYQTDVQHAGTWIDKSFLCHLAAARTGSPLLWHKIVCRKPAGRHGFGRPGYAHLLCYSRGVRDRRGLPRTDVLLHTGETLWSQATPVEACEVACHYVDAHTTTRTVVDPFCG